MKFLSVLFCSFILFPLSGVSLQDPGDPDSVVNEVDTICFRQDSLIYINDPRHTFSTNFNWLDSSERTILPSPEFYKTRYQEGDLMYKVVDNWGKGFDSLYGTRNLRPILHGVAYRGGANNYFHESKKRKNSNPLPADGIDNLCEEGFSQSVYLYRTNFDSAPLTHSCNCSNGGINQMKYAQYDYYDEQHIYDMLKIVYESAINDSVGPVYLHCWNGWHASGYISALILKQFCGMSDIEATAYWDLGTDGANTSPRYNSIRENIKNFQPYQEFMLTSENGERICPPMPEIIDSSMLFLTVEHLAIVPEAIPVGTIMIMTNVKFAPNSTTLPAAASNPDLNYLLDALQKNTDLKIEIGGHTDKSGKAATNKMLSEKRARWVHDYLVKNGVSREQLTFKGYGHYKPAYTNRTKDGRAANRRIEIKLLSKNRGNQSLLVDESPADSSSNEQQYKLENLPTSEIGACIILDEVTFEPGKSAITDSNSKQLENVVYLMNKYSTIKLEIGGYTDKSGIPEKNLLISQDRARAVFDFFISKGVEKERLTHVGYGDAKPIAPNKYRWGRDKNRRIELKLTAL